MLRGIFICFLLLAVGLFMHSSKNLIEGRKDYPPTNLGGIRVDLTRNYEWTIDFFICNYPSLFWPPINDGFND